MPGLIGALQTLFSPPERKQLNFYLDNKMLTDEAIHTKLYTAKDQGASYQEIFHSLTPDDFKKSPEERQVSMLEAKQKVSGNESKTLADILTNRLADQSKGYGQQLQDFFAPGPLGQLLAQPGVSNNYAQSQLPQNEQSWLSLYGKGGGDVNKASENMPSLLKAPPEQKPLTWSEQENKDWLEGLQKLTPEQQNKQKYPRAFLQQKPQEPPSPADIKTQVYNAHFAKLPENEQKQVLFQQLFKNEGKGSTGGAGGEAFLKWLADKPIHLQEDYSKAIDEIDSNRQEAINGIDILVALHPDKTKEEILSDINERTDAALSDVKTNILGSYQQSITITGQNADQILGERWQNTPEWWNAMHKNSGERLIPGATNQAMPKSAPAPKQKPAKKVLSAKDVEDKLF